MSNITPLIKTLQLQGGTFYSFSSAARDITKTFNNEDLDFVFSKFAALNIPNIERPTRKENFVQFNTIDGSIFNNDFNDVNTSLAESFQNYALNLESLLLNDLDYDPNSKKTVSENVFFKWMKEIGAIRFKEASPLEKNPDLNERLFTEESTSKTGDRRYQRVVEYVGDLNVINNLSYRGQGYTEIYMYIPDKDGNTPNILFSAKENGVYSPGKIINGDSEFISGRDNNDTHPAGLSLSAFYDYDDPIAYSNSQNANWHGSSTPNSYYLEPTSFSNSSNIEITKNNLDYPGLNFTEIEYERSRLDGIGIEFNSEAYTQIITNPNISTIQEFNATSESRNFEFNAILIYYDLFNPSAPSERATNLYGVLFLDNVTPTTDGGFIERYKKVKFNSVTRINGNSYGLKLNLKFDSSIDNSAIETVINDYNGYSLELYSDALTRMQETTTIFRSLIDDYQDFNNRLDALDNFIYNQEDINQLKDRFSRLESNFNNANLMISNSQAIYDMIGNLSDRLNQIFAGEVPSELVFNLDIFTQGPGLRIRTSDSGVRFENINQTYTSTNIKELDLGLQNTNDFLLGKFGTYYQISNRSTNEFGITVPNSLDDVLRIRINDTVEPWKKGQSLKLNFKNPLDLGNYFIEIRTDAKNLTGNGNYGRVLDVIDNQKLTRETPIIEIVCLDEINFIFDVLIS